MKTTRRILPLTLAIALGLATVSRPLSAQDTYTWIGSANDGLWSNAANWNTFDGAPTSIAPGASDSAALSDTDVARTIIYDAVASGSLHTLSFGQLSAFANTLEIRRTLSLATALDISSASGATAGASSKVFVNTSSVADDHFAAFTNTAASALTVTDGVTVGNGGILEFGRKAGNGGNQAILTYLTGDLAIDGGSLVVQRAVTSVSNTPSSFQYTIDGALSLSSGTLTLGTSSTNTGSSINDTRFAVTGNFTATGGVIDNRISSSYTYNINLGGAENIIGTADAVTLRGNPGFVLTRSGAQSLTSGQALSQLVLRTSGTKTLSIDGGVGKLIIRPDNNQANTLTLARDLVVTGELTGHTTDNSATINIDTAGHTLDTSSGLFTVNGASRIWNIRGGGILKAASIDLSAVRAASVEGSTTLVATAAGSANNLGNSGGAISADSIFIYAAAAGSVASTLESGRDIGHLVVESGTLALIGDTDIAATTVTVHAGGILDTTARAFTTTARSLTLGITGTTFGQIATNDIFNADGVLTLNFGDTPAASGDYALFGLGTTLTGAFDSVVFSGLYSGIELTAVNAWTAAAGDITFSFNAASGILSIAAVPEPAALTALAGLCALALALARRRA